MTIIKLAFFLLSLLVTACHNSTGSVSESLGTSKPKILSRVDNSLLSVKVTINGSLQYDGRLQADGTWVVSPQGLELGADHTIVNEWFGQHETTDYLLVRQQGSFYADPETLQAVLDLPDVSAGLPEFDFDCDGTSNLEEFNAGSDPGTLPGCDPGIVDPEPENPQRAWVVHSFQAFVLAGYILPVKRVDQPILVESVDSTKGMSFGVGVDTSLVPGGDDKVSLNLTRDENGIKTAEISIHPGLSTQAAVGGSCYDGGEHKDWLACSVPFDWQLDHWYTLRVTESPNASPTMSLWDGWVVDQETGDTFALGTVQATENITLHRAAVGSGYFFPHDQTECTAGLPGSTINYLSPEIDNNVFSPMPESLEAGPCAQNGGGWSSDDSEINGDNDVVFSLTLGQ